MTKKQKEEEIFVFVVAVFAIVGGVVSGTAASRFGGVLLPLLAVFFASIVALYMGIMLFRFLYGDLSLKARRHNAKRRQHIDAHTAISFWVDETKDKTPIDELVSDCFKSCPGGTLGLGVGDLEDIPMLMLSLGEQEVLAEIERKTKEKEALQRYERDKSICNGYEWCGCWDCSIYTSYNYKKKIRSRW